MEPSGGGTGSSRATGVCQDFITVEEEFARLTGCKEVVDELHNLRFREKVFQQGRVVVPTKVKRLLQLGCKPPMSLIHDSNQPGLQVDPYYGVTVGWSTLA